MKKLSLFLFALLFCVSLFGQHTNRYSMKLTKNSDDTYTLDKSDRYVKIVDLESIPDLLVPYTRVSKLIKTSDYYPVETREFVYKTYPDYELKLIVDIAVSDTPAPFMIYLHGGGWARGDFGANRPLSQYLAKQKGVTGVRVAYTLAPQTGANVNVSIQDVKDALKYLQDNAAALNIDPTRYGFNGGSAGAHLAAVAAMTTGAKVLVGYSGIYDLESAAITSRAKDPERIAYFLNKDPKVLHAVSPINLIPNKNIPAVMLACGTGDIVVEWSQSKSFAEALKAKGANNVVLNVYDYYDHGLTSTSSDKMEECLLNSVEFISANIF